MNIERNTLADALATATPEQLREDAAALVRLVNTVEASGFSKTSSGPNLRLAALALAVATMQERGYGVDAAFYGSDGPVVWYDTNERDPDEESPIRTLPAALAQLVKEGA